jgi:hypothetical protein
MACARVAAESGAMNQTTLRSGRFFRHSFAVALVASLAATGCVPEDDADQTESAADDEALGEAASEICLFPPAPGYDTSRTLAPVNDFEEVISPSGGYGNGACDYYGVRFISGDRGRVRPYSLPTSESSCEHTTVTAKFYTRSGSSWVHQNTTSRTGVWSGGACTNLSISVDPGGILDLLVIGQQRYEMWSGDIGAQYNSRVSITGWSPALN